MEISVAVVVPVMLPFRSDTRNTAWFAKAIEQIMEQSGVVHCTTDWGGTPKVQIHCFSDPSSYGPLQWRPRSLRDYSFLQFSMSEVVDVDEYMAWFNSQIAVRGHEINHSGAARLVGDLLVSRLAKTAADTLLASHIAFPGAIAAEQLLLFVEDQYLRNGERLHGKLDVAIERAQEFSWPSFSELSIDDVLKWMDSVPGFSDAEPRGPAGRALSALSVLLVAAPDDVVGLVWALVGLEALYGRGNTGLKAQLMDKSEIVLGPRSAYKKRFQKMYDFRSRFVHGDIDFPLAYSPWDPDFQSGTFHGDASEAVDIATAMLVASLQQLIIKGQTYFEFSYALR